jgi:hypothetical protein
VDVIINAFVLMAGGFLKRRPNGIQGRRGGEQAAKEIQRPSNTGSAVGSRKIENRFGKDQ